MEVGGEGRKESVVVWRGVSGFRVSGLGVGVWDLGLSVGGLEFRA